MNDLMDRPVRQHLFQHASDELRPIIQTSRAGMSFQTVTRSPRGGRFVIARTPPGNSSREPRFHKIPTCPGRGRPLFSCGVKLWMEPGTRARVRRQKWAILLVIA
jgi:hypothetical protein